MTKTRDVVKFAWRDPQCRRSRSCRRLSEQEHKLVWATQGVPAADLFDQKMEGAAWRSKPSWYIVANNDRTLQPGYERLARPNEM
jgi:hypothetical protein